jgi:hypothetical protein
MIDGKPSLLVERGVEAISKTLDSAIKAVEIIVHQPKYDAAGSAGIFTIVLKKISCNWFNWKSTTPIGYAESSKIITVLNHTTIKNGI